MANQYTSTYDRRKMQDITVSEISAFQNYLNCWKGETASQIMNNLNTFLSSADYTRLKYKIFNAYNWNRLIDLINDSKNGTPATYNSLVGKWQIDFNALQVASEDFVDKGTWATSTSYKVGNLVKGASNPYISYICISDHTSSTESELSNTSLWLVAQENLAPNPIVVSATIPNNYKEGDIFLKTI